MNVVGGLRGCGVKCVAGCLTCFRTVAGMWTIDGSNGPTDAVGRRPVLGGDCVWSAGLRGVVP